LCRRQEQKTAAIVQPFDTVMLVGKWQALPHQHWQSLYARFSADRSHETAQISSVCAVVEVDEA
jgi:hypothetical protein